MSKFEQWETVVVKEEIKKVDVFDRHGTSLRIKDEMKERAGSLMKISSVLFNRAFGSMYKLEDGYWYPEQFLEKQSFKTVFNNLEV